MNISPRFTLNWYDAYKGLQMFVITTALMTIGGIVVAPDFSVFSADWIGILKNTIDVSFIATFSYIMKNFLTSTTTMLE
jgi:hypothetical protein